MHGNSTAKNTDGTPYVYINVSVLANPRCPPCHLPLLVSTPTYTHQSCQAPVLDLLLLFVASCTSIALMPPKTTRHLFSINHVLSVAYLSYRVGQNHIYIRCTYMTFLAGIPPHTYSHIQRSIHRSGHPCRFPSHLCRPKPPNTCSTFAAHFLLHPRFPSHLCRPTPPGTCTDSSWVWAQTLWA